MLMVISATMATAQIKQDSTLVSVGYGSEDQHRLTGAVDQVTQERMKKGLVTNSLEALSGQAAGVEVQAGIN